MAVAEPEEEAREEEAEVMAVTEDGVSTEEEEVRKAEASFELRSG